MARVTVEDCIKCVNNRFALVLMASQRAKDIARGARASVPKDNDKPTIVALREIAEEAISIDGLYVLTKNRIVDGPETQEDGDVTVALEGAVVRGPDDSDGEPALDEEDLAALMDMDAILEDEEEEDGDDEDSDADTDIDPDLDPDIDADIEEL
jgi:DNA-directed RNA polymerase subunit omega